MIPDSKTFAQEWIAAWNSHDLDRIMAHYSDDVKVTSPMIRVALGIPAGSLKGKEEVRRYWQAALLKLPDLRFELVEATQGVESVALYYRSVMGRMAIEVMFFAADGKVAQVTAHYT